MLNSVKKWIGCATFLLMAGAAQASNINVGGVVWDPDSPADFQANGNIYETFASCVKGEIGCDPADYTVSGFGLITQFNGTTEDVYCPGCELTLTFSMELVSAAPLGGNVFSFAFDNLVVSMFVDAAENYDQLSPSLATASDGLLFLSAVNNGLITGFASNLFDALNIIGSGQGFVDVNGGLAEGNFDTNTKLNGADLSFTSSFQDASLDVPGYPLFGSVDLSGNTIPAPGTLLLLGLGLIGVRFARRRSLV